MLQLMRETLTWSSRPLLEWQWWAPTRLGDSSLWTFSRDSVIKVAISSGRIPRIFRDPQSWNTVPVSSTMAKSSNSSMRFSQGTTPPLTPWIVLARQLVMFDYPIMFPFNSISMKNSIFDPYLLIVKPPFPPDFPRFRQGWRRRRWSFSPWPIVMRTCGARGALWRQSWVSKAGAPNGYQLPWDFDGIFMGS